MASLMKALELHLFLLGIPGSNKEASEFNHDMLRGLTNYWHFLASPPRVGMGSTLSSVARNTRELAFLSTAARTQRILTIVPRNANLIGLYVYRCYLQAHGSIIVAFHL
jgi:hypothetical protein